MIPTEKNRSSVKGMVCDGVKLVSRYNDAIEYSAMSAAVRRMGDHKQAVISIFCDTKAGNCYSIALKKNGTNRAILDRIDQSFDGHNGIVIEEPSGQISHIDPRWPDEEFQ